MARAKATPPPGDWDDRPKAKGARVRLTTGTRKGQVGTIERNQRVTRPGWDEDHHWVRLDSGRLVLYAPRFLELVED
jgi:hypothetical protein